MSAPVAVHIHPSEFPGALEAALEASLRQRRMPPRFLYDTPKRTRLWLRVQEAYSPAATDPSGRRIYELASAAAVRAVGNAASVTVVALGCGSGQKDAQLLGQLLAAGSRPVRFVPVDVSPGLVLMAREAALAAGVRANACAPLVMDLAAVADWDRALAAVLAPKDRRLVTFFGLLPNFTPGTVLGRLAALLRPGDALLASANLAPGPDYRAGVERIRPLYDNPLTREWVLAVLLDLGIEREDGELVFRVADCPEGSGLRRVEFDFVFRRSCALEHAGRTHRFDRGEPFQLFFSYRHTPQRVAEGLRPHGLAVAEAWVNDAGEEGVFRCRREPSPPDQGEPDY